MRPRVTRRWAENRLICQNDQRSLAHVRDREMHCLRAGVLNPLCEKHLRWRTQVGDRGRRLQIVEAVGDAFWRARRAAGNLICPCHAHPVPRNAAVKCPGAHRCARSQMALARGASKSASVLQTYASSQDPSVRARLARALCRTQRTRADGARGGGPQDEFQVWPR
jgi:hypothetical protein